jgi:hypothetical protein
MLIPILRNDNQYDFVKGFILNRLIESKGIVKFKRSTGWVTIGTDPIRKINRNGASISSDKRTENE